MQMTNQVLNFDQFERLYESYDLNSINEAEDVLFTPEDLIVEPEELKAVLAPEGATGAKPVEEALDPKAFSPIKRGEKSERVKQLQKDLNFPTDAQDGIFGKGTEDKVLQFQKNNKLTIDGKVGVQTLRKMLELNGDKNAEATIASKYISTAVKSVAQATAIKIDPKLLELFDVSLCSNGTEQIVIMIPKKDAPAKAKALQQSKFAIPEWFKVYLRHAGTFPPSVLIVAAEGIYQCTVEFAKGIISALANAAKQIAGGAAFVIGAGVQGLIQVANWAAKKGTAAFQKVSNAFDAFFTRFCNGFAAVYKASVQAFTAFIQGLQTAGLVIAGAAIKAFKKISSQLGSAVKAIVNAATDAASFIKAGIAYITKQGAEAQATFKKNVQAGWDTVIVTTQKAWNGAKSAVQASGEAIAQTAKKTYTETADYLKSCYEEGKKAFESLTDIYGDPIFESSFADLDFSIA